MKDELLVDLPHPNASGWLHCRQVLVDGFQQLISPWEVYIMWWLMRFQVQLIIMSEGEFLVNWPFFSKYQFSNMLPKLWPQKKFPRCCSGVTVAAIGHVGFERSYQRGQRWRQLLSPVGEKHKSSFGCKDRGVEILIHRRGHGDRAVVGLIGGSRYWYTEGGLDTWNLDKDHHTRLLFT